jgi:DNA-directed RNA polymerase specialized sigma24 family protein
VLLTITSTKAPATDLGYLLHKNPNRLQSFETSFGNSLPDAEDTVQEALLRAWRIATA